MATTTLLNEPLALLQGELRKIQHNFGATYLPIQDKLEELTSLVTELRGELEDIFGDTEHLLNLVPKVELAHKEVLMACEIIATQHGASCVAMVHPTLEYTQRLMAHDLKRINEKYTQEETD